MAVVSDPFVDTSVLLAGLIELGPASRAPQQVMAHIAEVARRGGCRLIVTDNTRHFAPLAGQGVRVASSADLAAELA